MKLPFQRVYVTTARQVKRIDSVKRSPVYANFTETLNGTSSIRAYQVQRRFVDHADLLLDNNQKVWFTVFTSNRLVRMGQSPVTTLRPKQNGRHFADDILKCIFLNENVWILSLKFVPKGLINNNPALVQVMTWRRPGDKPLSEAMMVRLPTHIYVTRPQWVNGSCCLHVLFYSVCCNFMRIIVANSPDAHIPQCIRQISHNAPFCNRNAHTCAHFCYKVVHCEICV